MTLINMEPVEHRPEESDKKRGLFVQAPCEFAENCWCLKVLRWSERAQGRGVVELRNLILGKVTEKMMSWWLTGARRMSWTCLWRLTALGGRDMELLVSVVDASGGRCRRCIIDIRSLPMEFVHLMCPIGISYRHHPIARQFLDVS